MADPVNGQQRQAWREALARHGRLSRGRGQHRRRTGLGTVSGVGRIRVRVILPDVVDGQGDDDRGDGDGDAGQRGDDDINASSARGEDGRG